MCNRAVVGGDDCACAPFEKKAFARSGNDFGENKMNYDRVIAVRTSKTVYRDGDSCIKTFDADYSAEDVMNEAIKQEKARKTGLNVPAVRAIIPVGDGWGIISDYVRGKTLERIVSENPSEKKKLYSEFVDLQIKVQSKSIDSLQKTNEKIALAIKRSALDENAKDKLLSSPVLSAKGKIGLCHGDFNPSNVIKRSAAEAYIVDWPHATYGNVLFDAAATYLWFCAEAPVYADAYAETYCEKTRSKKSDLLACVPYAAVLRLARARQSEREFFKSFII